MHVKICKCTLYVHGLLFRRAAKILFLLEFTLHNAGGDHLVAFGQRFQIRKNKLRIALLRLHQL